MSLLDLLFLIVIIHKYGEKLATHVKYSRTSHLGYQEEVQPLIQRTMPPD